MDYNKLSREEFDAQVTGELTHLAIWLQDELEELISNYFVSNQRRKADFTRLILRRDGLTFQDKIEIVRAMIPLFGEASTKSGLPAILREIEEFKAFRNAMAHGHDSSEKLQSPILAVTIVSRSGKERTIEISPESHLTLTVTFEKLLLRMQQARKAVLAKPRAIKSQ